MPRDPNISEAGDPSLGRLWLGRQAQLWQEGAARFYVWSAVIRDGELAGIDFAPNEGWLAIPPLEP